MEKEVKNLTEKIGLGEKLSYGLGDVASNIVMTFTSSYLTYYYTNSVGISISAAGLIFMLTRIFDGFSDILMGYIMDRTHSRHGKARSWMLWMAVPIGIALFLTVTIPEGLPVMGKFIYAFITYNLVTTVCYTAINIPYGALNSLMTRDQYQRSVINLFRMVMASLGGVVIGGITMPAINAMGGTRSAWITLVGIYSVTASILFLISYKNTRERVTDGNTEEASKISLKNSLAAMAKNKYWLMICFAWLMMAITQALVNFTTVYYAQYVLGNSNAAGTLNVLTNLPALFAMLVLAPLIKRFGKKKVALAGCVCMIAGQAIIAISPVSMPVVMTGCILRGLGCGPILGTVFAMVADTIEYGQWKTGIRIQGILYSSTTFGSRVGSGVGAAAASWLLAAVGFDGMLQVQSENAIRMLKVEFVYLPIIFILLAAFGFLFYHLDEEYPQIISDLQKGKTSMKGE